MAEEILRLSKLNLWLRRHDGERHILKDVEMVVEKGARVAVVGESGSGKSLTLRLLLGLLPRSGVRIGGEAFFAGRRILDKADLDWDAMRARSLGVIFQDPVTALSPYFRVGDQLTDIVAAAYPRAAAVILRELAQLLQEMAVAEPERLLNSYPFQLSGGECQRISIAMAVVNKPALLLADEPATALDVTVQEQALQLIDRFVARLGQSLVLVSHNLGVVRKYSDYVYVMYGGMVVEHAPTAELFKNPRHPYTKSLFNAIPRLSGAMPSATSGALIDYRMPPPGCRFAPRCSLASAECNDPIPMYSDFQAQGGVRCIRRHQIS